MAHADPGRSGAAAVAARASETNDSEAQLLNHRSAAVARVARALDARGKTSSGATLIDRHPYNRETVAELPLDSGDE
ncbi:phosphonoacetaldehyde dehydrogenase, partial [Burkholderia pseudomallei]